VMFVAAAFAILWGTVYPIIAEAVTGIRLSVGPPFFNSVFVPLGLVILALTGIGPLISWRGMSPGRLTRIIRWPVAAAALCIAALAAAGITSAGTLAAFGLCAFTATAVAGEFIRGSRMYRRKDRMGWGSALSATLLRNRRRYGGYVVHLGIVLLVIGLAGNAFKQERRAHLDRGQSMRVGDYTLTYEALRQARTPEKQINAAQIAVARSGDRIATLLPQRNLHIAQGQPQSEVAIRTDPVEDLYLVVTAFDPDGSVALRAFVNPLTWWIWAGAFVMAAGMVVIFTGVEPVRAVAPARGRVREPAVAR
jgi:cytochrome c-type biogenesis protein CcmF